MGSVFLLLSCGVVQVYIKYGVFTSWLPYTIALMQQGLLTSFVPSDLNFQEFYSLLHPVLFYALAIAIFRECAYNVTVALLFTVLGANWAFFFNDSLWSYDMVELVSLLILLVAAHAAHSFLVPHVKKLTFVLLSAVRFGAVPSYHIFSNTIYVTTNTLTAANSAFLSAIPYIMIGYVYWMHPVGCLRYGRLSYAYGYRVRLVLYHA